MKRSGEHRRRHEERVKERAKPVNEAEGVIEATPKLNRRIREQKGQRDWFADRLQQLDREMQGNVEAFLEGKGVDLEGDDAQGFDWHAEYGSDPIRFVRRQRPGTPALPIAPPEAPAALEGGDQNNGEAKPATPDEALVEA